MKDTFYLVMQALIIVTAKPLEFYYMNISCLRVRLELKYLPWERKEGQNYSSKHIAELYL